jgi:hypothetical protein
MMKKQTAVEWLDNRLKDESVLIQESEGYHICIRVGTLGQLINQAKQMEREQIIDAYNSGQQIPPFEYAEQYYNETYSK